MSGKPAVILLAHGSSDIHWCQTFENLAQPTLGSIGNASIAYMELSSPSLQDVVREGKANGMADFVVIPLFLAAGRHLRKDIPAMIAELERNQDVRIQLTPPVGENPLLGLAIRDVVIQTLEESERS